MDTQNVAKFVRGGGKERPFYIGSSVESAAINEGRARMLAALKMATLNVLPGDDFAQKARRLTEFVGSGTMLVSNGLRGGGFEFAWGVSDHAYSTSWRNTLVVRPDGFVEVAEGSWESVYPR